MSTSAAKQPPQPKRPRSTSIDLLVEDAHGNTAVVPHYPVAVVAQRVHMGRGAVRDKCRSGEWPWQPVGKRGVIYMSDADIVEALRRDRERAIEQAQQYGIKGVVASCDEPDDDDSDEGIR